MRRVVVCIAATAALAAGVVVFTNIGSHNRSASMVPRAGANAPRSVPTATGVVGTDGGTSEASDDGSSSVSADAVAAARTAGVAAVARTASVFEAGFISRQDLIGEFTTTRFAPTLVERTSRQVIDLLFGLRQAQGQPVDVQLVAQPVTATATASSGGRVAVDVWTVAVFVASGQASTPEQWLTVHLEMVEQGGRWLVDGWETSAGPAPTPPAEGSFGAAADVATVVRWSPAGVGSEGG